MKLKPTESERQLMLAHSLERAKLEAKLLDYHAALASAIEKLEKAKLSHVDECFSLPIPEMNAPADDSACDCSGSANVHEHNASIDLAVAEIKKVLGQ